MTKDAAQHRSWTFYEVVKLQMKITRSEELETWQEARRLVKLVYDAINGREYFAKGYRLVGQIQAAAV
jgi:hypothetical protein